MCALFCASVKARSRITYRCHAAHYEVAAANLKLLYSARHNKTKHTCRLRCISGRQYKLFECIYNKKGQLTQQLVLSSLIASHDKGCVQENLNVCAMTLVEVAPNSIALSSFAVMLQLSNPS